MTCCYYYNSGFSKQELSFYLILTTLLIFLGELLYGHLQIDVSSVYDIYGTKTSLKTEFHKGQTSRFEPPPK